MVISLLFSEEELSKVMPQEDIPVCCDTCHEDVFFGYPRLEIRHSSKDVSAECCCAWVKHFFGNTRMDGYLDKLLED